MVSYINELRQQGHSLDDAVTVGAETKFRRVCAQQCRLRTMAQWYLSGHAAEPVVWAETAHRPPARTSRAPRAGSSLRFCRGLAVNSGPDRLMRVLVDGGDPPHVDAVRARAFLQAMAPVKAPFS